MWGSIQDIFRPETLDDVIAIVTREKGKAAILSGGTQLVAERNPNVKALVDISRLGLDYIVPYPDRICIGAATRLHAIEKNEECTSLAGGIFTDAIRSDASISRRNRGTLGGSLASVGAFDDSTLALLALDAKIVLRNPDRVVVSLADFLSSRTRYLSAPSLIEEAIVPVPAIGSGAALTTVRRVSGEKALIAAAVLLDRKNNAFHSIRIALGGIAPIPIRMATLESYLEKKSFDATLRAHITREVEKAIDPPSDFRASAEYRRSMASLLVVRALEQAWAASKEN